MFLEFWRTFEAWRDAPYGGAPVSQLKVEKLQNAFSTRPLIGVAIADLFAVGLQPSSNGEVEPNPEQ
jgi:hypothetical protein